MKKFNKFLSVAVASAMVMTMAGCGNTDNGSALFDSIIFDEVGDYVISANYKNNGLYNGSFVQKTVSVTKTDVNLTADIGDIVAYGLLLVPCSVKTRFGNAKSGAVKKTHSDPSFPLFFF